jgi:SAM-dependent methyltransferase
MKPGFSPTFNAFARHLAMSLIERFDLRKKDIIEIGCGKGEFLTLLCELGDNRGIGFDPAYVSERDHSLIKNRVTFVKDFYSEKYIAYKGDFVCCKMTLEHIQKTAEFVATIRGSLRDRLETIVFFLVPDASHVLGDLAFWDIYYEHCSYFSAGSLARLFRTCEFEITDLWKDYDDQYLMIAARPCKGRHDTPFHAEEDIQKLAGDVDFFKQKYETRLESWKRFFGKQKKVGRRVVLWGGGSKAVAFLTTLNIGDEIEYVVDINPYRQGRS